jgi:zinc transport system ATP-binding protein
MRFPAPWARQGRYEDGARAPGAARKALLPDEPAAGLDPLATRTLYGLIETVDREIGLVLVMVFHDVRNAAQYASHTLPLHHGQVFFGKTDDSVNSTGGRAFFGRKRNA